MKNIFRISIIFFLSAIITNKTFAQSLEVIGAQLEVKATTEDDRYTSQAKFKNISSADKQVKIRVEAISLPLGFGFDMCDVNNCYAPQPGEMKVESENPFNLAPGEDTKNLFHMYIAQKDAFNPVTGTCILKAIAYVVSDTTDKVEYTANYIISAPDAVNDFITGSYDYMSLPTPNPAINYINFKCNATINGYIEIFNSRGDRVYNAKILPGSDFITVNTNGLSNGSYSALLTKDGRNLQKRNFVILK